MLVRMRTFTWLVVAPFLGAALLTAALLTAGFEPVPRAFACDCVGDGFWVVEDVSVEGADAPWPEQGHLYPDRFSLWAEGTSLEISYSP